MTNDMYGADISRRYATQQRRFTDNPAMNRRATTIGCRYATRHSSHRDGPTVAGRFNAR